MVSRVEERKRPLAPKAWQQPQTEPDWGHSHEREYPHDLPSVVDVEREWLRWEVSRWFELEQAEARRLAWKLLRGCRANTDLSTLEEVLRVFWEHREQEKAMSRLEDAANARDEHAFLEALEEVEWRGRPPADFTRAAKRALKAGAYKAAYQISVQGAEYHPDNQEVQKYARVLAPPKVVSRDMPPDPARKANREWLKAHSGEYSGQWVAVRNGDLLGATKSLKELTEQVGDTEGVLLTRAQ